MKVLVTGCAGLIGSNFCRWLPPDVDVVGVDDLSGGYADQVPDRVTFVKADLTSPEGQAIIESHFPVDYVFHFAAYAAEGLSPFIRQFNYRNNTIATAFLINMAIKHDVKRFVFTSSMAVYGDQEPPFRETQVPRPIDSYGIAKYACEMDLRVAWEQHGLEYCIIRPHNVYGPGQNVWDPYRNVLGIWMYQALKGLPMTIYGDGSQCRAFSYVDDIMEPLFKAAVDPRAKNEIINLGGKLETRLLDACHLVSIVTKHTAHVHLEARHEAKMAWSTYQKSVELLDYNETVTLTEGLIRMWAWLAAQPDRDRKLWDEYELDKGIYSFWKVT
jgi:UDP-glucose 4-epimerase